MGTGCLWNSFVSSSLLGCQLFLGLFLIAMPELWVAFPLGREGTGHSIGQSRLSRLYENIDISSFSDEVLVKCPHNLALQVNGV